MSKSTCHTHTSSVGVLRWLQGDASLIRVRVAPGGDLDYLGPEVVPLWGGTRAWAGVVSVASGDTLGHGRDHGVGLLFRILLLFLVFDFCCVVCLFSSLRAWSLCFVVCLCPTDAYADDTATRACCGSV